MAKPCILCVAITGSLPTKADTPAVPISIAEQIESTQAAFEAGASLVHAHVRNEDETPSSDPERFARLQEGLVAALSRHDHPVLDRGPLGGRTRPGRDAEPATGHGVAFRGLQQFPDPGL